MFNKELYESTKKLVNQLTYFIVHIVTYFVVNIVLVLLIFSNFNVLWWILFPIILWAILLVYHGIVIYRGNQDSGKLQGVFMVVINPFYNTG